MRTDDHLCRRLATISYHQAVNFAPLPSGRFAKRLQIIEWPEWSQCLWGEWSDIPDER
ncbi:hypothetical protein GALLN_00199 [Gallionellaceae bacterium]|nr:hypothetical protein GALLN_00199 [Gallionellaceae bacterium]